jgi:hypothetical protein
MKLGIFEAKKKVRLVFDSKVENRSNGEKDSKHFDEPYTIVELLLKNGVILVWGFSFLDLRSIK